VELTIATKAETQNINNQDGTKQDSSTVSLKLFGVWKTSTPSGMTIAIEGSTIFCDYHVQLVRDYQARLKVTSTLGIVSDTCSFLKCPKPADLQQCMIF
jgi:hypothetical protein